MDPDKAYCWQTHYEIICIIKSIETIILIGVTRHDE